MNIKEGSENFKVHKYLKKNGKTRISEKKFTPCLVVFRSHNFPSLRAAMDKKQKASLTIKKTDCQEK